MTILKWRYKTEISLNFEISCKLRKYLRSLYQLCMECKENLIKKEGGNNEIQRKQIETRITKSETRIIDALNEACSKEKLAKENLAKQLEDRMTEIERAFNELKKQQVDVETSIKEHKEAVQTMPRVSEELKHSADQLQKIVQTRDQESRELNIIIHNVPKLSSQDAEDSKSYDVNSFYNIAHALMGNEATEIEVEKAIRQGKQKEPPVGDLSKPKQNFPNKYTQYLFGKK